MTSIRLLAVIEASTITGPAKNLLEFAALARSGRFVPAVEVSIATFHRQGALELFANSVRSGGLPLFKIPEKGRFDRSVVPGLREVLRAVGPHIVQTHAVKSHYLIRKAGISPHVPWVAFHHGYTWPDLKARLYNQLDRWSLPGADRVVTVSESFAKELVAIGVSPGRIAIVHNAIDPQWTAAAWKSEALATLRRELQIDESRKVVLIVGRLSKEKDHATLLRAFAHMRREGAGHNAHLLAVGDGPERSRIEGLIRALNLSGHVTLTGQKASVGPYYALADIAVLSSRSEGSPNALLEAMAARIPVVATAVGGVPEIVADGVSALIVPPGNFVRLAAAIAAILVSPEVGQRLADNAHCAVLSRHSPEERTRRLCAIYGSLVFGARPCD
jgi:glycosyltransferase involved in cell wall biosynthesis